MWAQKVRALLKILPPVHHNSHHHQQPYQPQPGYISYTQQPTYPPQQPYPQQPYPQPSSSSSEQPTYQQQQTTYPSYQQQQQQEFNPTFPPNSQV